jgi:hypothetical protein
MMFKIRNFISVHRWFFVSLILAVFLAFFRFNQGVIQQDNYVLYAKYLPLSVSTISFFESRLLPGLPILIYLFGAITRNFYVAGYIVTILSFAGSYFLLYKITRSRLSILPLFFPPILLNLASLIDTEFPFIFLAILGYYLVKKRNFAWAFLIFGISIWFRIAGVALMFGVFVYFVLTKKLRDFLVYLPYFLAPIAVLMVYNTYFFGSGNMFYQLSTYGALHPGRISFGIIQLGEDLVRAVRWHWYRIFVSGLFYVVFFAVAWVKSINVKSLEFWLITGIYLFTLIVNLVPFLENLGRYLAPAIPFFWIIFYPKLKGAWLLYLLLLVSAVVVLI